MSHARRHLLLRALAPKIGWQRARRASLGERTIVQLLASVEIDGHSIAFASGLLLRRKATTRLPESWHITLLRVPTQDMCWAEGRAGQECELQVQTQRGAKLSGRASLVNRESAPDSLRLIGVSPLRSS